MFVQQVVQPRQPFSFTASGILAGHGGRRGAGTHGIFERECRRVAGLAHQGQGLLEIGVALARKADDEVAGKSDVRPRRADALDQPQIVVGSVGAVHGLQHPVATPTAPADAGRASAPPTSP